MLVSNALQLATLNSVGDFILFLGKCFVTAVTGSLGLLLLKRDENLKFYAIPVLVIAIFSFFIAHCVLSLYEVCTPLIYSLFYLIILVSACILSHLLCFVHRLSLIHYFCVCARIIT